MTSEAMVGAAGALVGAVVAILVMHLLGRARLREVTSVAAADAERAQAALRAELAAANGRIEGIVRERDDARERTRVQERLVASRDEALAAARAAHDETRLALARRDADLNARDARLREQAAFLEQARAALTEQFKAASQDVLAANTEFLTEQARARLVVEHERIAQRLAPVADSVGKLETLVTRVETERAEAGARLHEQLAAITRSHHDLSDQTRRLVMALRDPKARGRWGEMQLKRVVEFAGMLAHCDFDEQTTTVTDGQQQRPDLIVHLPGDKCIVVDAKAPLGAYLDAVELTQDDARDVALQRHAAQLRTHVRALQDKAYWSAFDASPDLVVLFVPGEAFLQAALIADPSLLDDALHANVLLASPVNLVALLKSAAYGWQQDRLARNAAAIRSEAVELVKRVAKLAEHFDGIGAGLRKAADAYNAMHGSFTRRIEPMGRRLDALGITFDDRLEKPKPVETVLVGDTPDPLPYRADTIGPVVPTVLLDDATMHLGESASSDSR